MHFGILVLGMDHAGEVEEFGSLVDLCPEPVFHLLLCFLQTGLVLERVQVGQNPHDAREAVDL